MSATGGAPDFLDSWQVSENTFKSQLHGCPLWCWHHKILHYQKRDPEGSPAHCYRKLHRIGSLLMQNFCCHIPAIGSSQICSLSKMDPGLLCCFFFHNTTKKKYKTHTHKTTQHHTNHNPKSSNCYRMNCLMFPSLHSLSLFYARHPSSARLHVYKDLYKSVVLLQFCYF